MQTHAQHGGMSNRFRQHQHVCALYESEEEQRAMASEYLADGLRRGERCVYCARSPTALEQLRAALTAAGIDVERMISHGALVERTHADTYVVNGCFDTDRVLGLLNKSVESALNRGFLGLRTCGDMSWLVEGPPGSTQLVEYEALLNERFRSVPAAGMCQYDRRRVPAHQLDHALTTHSSVLLEGHHRLNPFYRAPGIAMRRPAQPHKVEWKMTELRHARLKI
jgi:MEDS: MEthanogen/methylotroph, DcmR Sensory domain